MDGILPVPRLPRPGFRCAVYILGAVEISAAVPYFQAASALDRFSVAMFSEKTETEVIRWRGNGLMFWELHCILLGISGVQ
jgi:hypothetical protein